MGGTSRITRECYVRICERLGVKFPGPTRLGHLEVGRINVRNGVALGFNPTDFFKTGSLVDQASLDPTVVRLNRLGTVMTRFQASGGHSSLDRLWELTGTIPAPAPTVLPNDSNVRFGAMHRSALSWTGENKVTVDLEYEYHRAGLSLSDWAQLDHAACRRPC
jgi:hypothetical protein